MVTVHHEGVSWQDVVDTSEEVASVSSRGFIRPVIAAFSPEIMMIIGKVNYAGDMLNEVLGVTEIFVFGQPDFPTIVIVMGWHNIECIILSLDNNTVLSTVQLSHGNGLEESRATAILPQRVIDMVNAVSILSGMSNIR